MSEDLYKYNIYLKEKGLYKINFSSTISNATTQEIENAPLYAIQLIARKLKLDADLIHLMEDDETPKNNSVPAKIVDYGVYIGLYKIGKIRILTQKTDYYNTITFVFKQRVKLGQYKKYIGRDNYNKFKERYLRGNQADIFYRLEKLKEK